MFLSSTLPFALYIFALCGIGYVTLTTPNSTDDDCCEVSNYYEVSGLQQIRHNDQ